MFNNIHALSNILKPALNGLQARQNAISNNLANVDTPGFKTTEVLFEETLQNKLNQRPSVSGSYTHERHMALGLPEDSVIQKMHIESNLREDGNNVDIDAEMTKMAQASISYNAVSQMLAGRYSGLKFVISEAGR